MAYSNYSEIRTALAYGRPFNGNSASAHHDVYGAYHVYSYGTRILSCDGDTVVYFDNRAYSRTTSRLQRMVREETPDVRDCTARTVYRFDALTATLAPRQ